MKITHRNYTDRRKGERGERMGAGRTTSEGCEHGAPGDCNVAGQRSVPLKMREKSTGKLVQTGFALL